MHSIKAIRENPDFFKKKIEERNVKLNIDDLLTLDKKNREITQKKEKLEQEKKIISKSKKEDQFKKSKEISNQIKILENELGKFKKSIKLIKF